MDKHDALRTLAEIQHGLVARRQAHRLGFDGHAIGRLCASGEWCTATRQVLRRRGSPQTRDQALMLAVLDGPPGAILSHASAAEAWGLPGFNGQRIEIIQARTRFQRHLAQGVVHRPRLLLPHHVTEVRGVPVTTIGRSVFDIAPRLREERLGLLIDRIIAKSPGALTALRELLPELARRGRPGISAMRVQLAKRPKGYVPVASGLEMRFERICVEAGLPKMRRQVDKGGHEWIGRVDFADELAILYEVDSVLHHTTPGDVARDEARDRDLRAAGHPKIVRLREEDLWYHPDTVIEQVRTARADVLGMVRGRLAPRTMPSS